MNHKSYNAPWQAWYVAAVCFSMLFSLLGFGYTAWRMEQTESNETIRVASFRLLEEAASIQQALYLRVYDGEKKLGSPRRIWVSLGLLKDISPLVSVQVELEAIELYQFWAESWVQISSDKQSLEAFVSSLMS